MESFGYCGIAAISVLSPSPSSPCSAVCLSHVGQLPTKRFIRVIRAIPAPDSSSRVNHHAASRAEMPRRGDAKFQRSRFSSAHRICLSHLGNRDFSELRFPKKRVCLQVRLASCPLINSRFQYGIFN